VSQESLASHALEHFGRGHVDDATLGDLILGVSEAAANAQQHGRSASSLRVWAVPGRVIAHIKDAGNGIRDPLAGLTPTVSTTGAGLGLWMIHQLGVTVALLHTPDGFTVQLTAEHDTPAPNFYPDGRFVTA
jgi:anti-sigma regulatory factor (Ser/Thr protein kinase)